MNKYTSFIFENYTYDKQSATLSLYYSFDAKANFCEKYKFSNSPLACTEEFRASFDQACKLLHLVAGISYYKAYIPKDIQIKNYTLSLEQASFFNKLYINGLAEFAYKNNLDISAIKFPYSQTAITKVEAGSRQATPKILVPIGGGKDSLVTVEMLKKKNIPFTTFQLGNFERINQVLKLISSPNIQVLRTIDPLLFELNKQNAYNGHVPISAIIASCLVITGLLHDYNSAILSNERSADFENLVYKGQKVNHQYSKSFEFEVDFSEYLSKYVASNFSYFSLLRPYNELAIAKEFSSCTTYDLVFSSCNRNFNLQKENQTNQRWCGKCPKCLATFLALAPFAEPHRLTNIFGENLLNKQESLPLLSELCGITKHKPFECVLDTNEALASMSFLANHQEWQNSITVKWFKELGVTNLPNLQSLLAPQGEHRIPSYLL